MADYITSIELKAQLSITDSTDDTQIALAASAASRLVDSLCGRSFSKDTTATTRIYRPMNSDTVNIHDAWEIVAVSTGTGDGTYPTAYTDYWTLPFNGVGVDHMAGWPVSAIKSDGGFTYGIRPTVEVEAKWGWENVPSNVKQATMLLAARLFRLRDVSFGAIAGSIDTGPLPVRDIRDVRLLLAPYMLLGIA